MSIGEDLAAARRQTGLTVTQVSQQTCIRETIIRAIEHDDYAVCGGDFYARGHIRAIAHVVGADPMALIAAYDAAHPPPTAVTGAALLGPAKPVRLREQHRPYWYAVLGLALMAVIGLAAYYVVTTSHPARGGHATAGAGRHPASRHHGAASPSTPPATTPAPAPYAHTVVIHLAAVEDCWVEFTTPRGGFLFQLIVAGGSSRRWVFRHAVDMRLGNPGGIRLTVDGKNPLPPGTAQPLTLRLRPGGKIST